MSQSEATAPTFPRVRPIDPFSTYYDAVILGGGMPGIGAALPLAQAGKKVLLVERRPLLGWETTSAFSCGFERTESPTVRLLHRSISTMRGLLDDRVDAPLMEVLLDQICDYYGPADRPGIDVLLYSTPVAVLGVGDSVRGVAVGNKAGEQVVRGTTYVDATDEALLWRQTDVAWQQADAPRVRQTLFFYPAGLSLKPPIALGDDPDGRFEEVWLRSSARSREVAVEYVVREAGVRAARLAAEHVVAFVRQRVPELAESAVTHGSVEPLPLGASRVLAPPAIQHPRLRNLFGAGLWTVGEARARGAAAEPAGRVALGEQTALAMLPFLEGELVSPNGRHAASVADGLPDQAAGGTLGRDLSSLPVREADVLVVGGGTAGSHAAIAAGRHGARVTVLEASTILGGMKTGSGQDYVGHGVPGGLQDEFHDRVMQAVPFWMGATQSPRLHPETARAVLEQMAADAGVEVVYLATAIGVEMGGVAGNTITGVVAATPEGTVLYRAQVVIDSSGDADVARMAGTPMQVGRDRDGVMHAYSQVCYLLEPPGRPQCTNWDAGYVDSFDVVDLTRARREGVRQVWSRFAPDPEGKRPLLTICPLLGVRQGHVIVGDYAPSYLEQILPTHFDDVVGYSGAKYDCHSQDPENQLDDPILWVWLLGNRERPVGNELPYRTMLPKGVEGLLVACRSASSPQETNYQFRTMRNQHRLGEAAGIAAALCVQLGTLPRALDVRLLRGELRESGALLPTGEQRADVVQPRSVEQAIGELTAGAPNVLKDAVWTLAHGGSEANAALRDFVRSGPTERRFWAALALAWQRDETALPELLQAVETRLAERADYTPRSRNQRPFWQSCVVMLGRIGSPAAVPALLDVLEDPASDLDQLIAAARALSRIGDTRAVPALERLLERDDAPRERRFQATKASSRWPEREDGLWQLELAVAEVLARFGRPRPEIVQRYLDDRRNQPRRYARIVATASGMPVNGPIAVEVRPGVARVVEDRALQQGHVDRNDFILRREDYLDSTMETAGRIEPRT